ncbi:D-alanyl-D-alanine carboxypeptidase/D-alanyl-D-alanine-endopeptidase [Chitinispirillales bacterium ANBcel5]|uniref:D-alanyl-D-alanine carboxypeptidase/D-alanyl-D-alanine endopeptidase n=1 Tax=Cellulosispirillum alkaliphilum TaxID=3039283 RepID=UPI002A54DD6C|nr:D-alanyl-D-alanine carboxypeptidase/D-alanyl-D-alanine-endopeptidase [Chitinispirillales bacterium ANBcel5]
MSRGGILYFSLFLVLIPVLDSWGNKQEIVEELLKRNGYTTGGIGVVIKDLETDSVLVSVNSDSLFNPASVLKLLTSAAALDILGPSYRFSTRVFIDSTFYSDSGVVDGNIYIQGRGDPGLNAQRLWLFVQQLYHRGVRKINGDLILDDFYFDTVSVGPGYTNTLTSRAYSPLISSLSANFSSVAIHKRSGQDIGSPVIVDIFPRIDGVTIKSTAKTTSPGLRSNLDVSTSSVSGQTQVNVRGVMSALDRPHYTYRKVWQTWEIFGGVIRDLFNGAGIEFNGQTLRERVPESLEEEGAFYVFRSQPLIESVEAMLKYSSNFASEMVLKTISAEKNAIPGSWSGGVEVLREWWNKNEFPGELVLNNGSGMGDVNRISADQIVNLLSYISQQRTYFPDLLSSLAIAGVDGTLDRRFRRSRLKGIVRAKTGTLNSLNVSTLAGYVLLEDRTYAFAILCNGIGNGQFDNWVMQEKILESVSTGVRWN